MPKAKVDILIKGYVKEYKDYKEYTSTCTLIRDGKINIIVDPGHPKSISFFKKALRKFNLKLEDIDIVFLTHTHLDHCRATAIFSKAKIIDVWDIVKNDRHIPHSKNNYHPSPSTTIIPTPGHSKDHASLLVKTDKGKVVIAGDLFWYSNMTPKKDPYVWDSKKLSVSRKKVIKIADYIIPGHGDIFKVKKS